MFYLRTCLSVRNFIYCKIILDIFFTCRNLLNFLLFNLNFIAFHCILSVLSVIFTLNYFHIFIKTHYVTSNRICVYYFICISVLFYACLVPYFSPHYTVFSSLLFLSISYFQIFFSAHCSQTLLIVILPLG